MDIFDELLDLLRILGSVTDRYSGDMLRWCLDTAEEILQQRYAGQPRKDNGQFDYGKKAVDKSGECGIINYAKAIDVFDGSTIKENTPINLDKVTEMLEESEVGREALAQLKERGVKPEIIYAAPRYGERGSQQGNNIKLYIQKIPNETVMAQTLIHETTHLYYGIEQSQWAEAVCFAKEKMFLTGKPLTVAQRRYIIKITKDNYPEFEWKRSGI